MEVEYIDRKVPLAADEVKMLSDKYAFTDENYETVIAQLKELGFINIITLPVYDIVFGWTEENSVKNVTINGADDYNRGSIFSSDAEIVVTYHLLEEDDPTKKEETSVEQTESAVLPTATITPTATLAPTSTEEPVFLEKGSKGDEVKKVQERLIELGYLKGKADGDFGNQTKAAVEAFQKAFGLEVTGAITNADMSKLFAAQTVASTEKTEEITGNLTVENCELLAKMLAAKNPGNLVGQFMTKYRGRIIEFDGNIAYMSKHENYKTRFDILIYAGDYSETSVSGPNFQFRDVNYNDLELTGRNIPDSVRAGQNYHIIAEVIRYDSSSELILLKPVSMELR